VYLNGAILGLRRAEIDRRFDEIVAFAGVERIELLRERGTTVLLISHHSGLVAQLCDRACLPANGRLVSAGPPAAIVAEYHRLVGAGAG
jgi:lipopolysaccharide transport system ATP-binding protein